MKVLYAVRPYEKIKGSANVLYDKWMEKCKESLKKPNILVYRENIKRIVREFEALEVTNDIKPKVGVVGEILVKFNPIANNDIVSIIGITKSKDHLFIPVAKSHNIDNKIIITVPMYTAFKTLSRFFIDVRVISHKLTIPAITYPDQCPVFLNIKFIITATNTIKIEITPTNLYANLLE